MHYLSRDRPPIEVNTLAYIRQKEAIDKILKRREKLAFRKKEEGLLQDPEQAPKVYYYLTIFYFIFFYFRILLYNNNCF